MIKSENSFYFLGDFYHSDDSHKIIIISFILLGILFFVIKIFWKRRCPNCNKQMKHIVNNKDEIIYKCSDCNTETKTGIYYGTDDS
jgi:hypothetical protein